MADRLSEEQLSDLREAFSFFDKNNEGVITVEGLEAAMRKIGDNPTQQELQDMISSADSYGSGTICFHEFVTTMGPRIIAGFHSEEQSREAFRVFDKDDNGLISAAELQQTMNDLGHPLTGLELRELIREGDIDGDGQINYEEFVKV